MQQWIIKANEAGQRLDKYLNRRLLKSPPGFVYKMLRKKNIVLNGKRAEGSAHLAKGDTVTLFLSDETIGKFRKNAPASEGLGRKYPVTNLDILYEDADVLVLNKPAGMLSQKAARKDVSANEYIIGYLLSSGQLTVEDLDSFTPSVCNRLDRNTSGLLIAGKSLAGLRDMSRRLKERSLSKYYQCLVAGHFSEAGVWEGWLKKDEENNRVTVSGARRRRKEAASDSQPDFSPQPDSRYIRTGFRPISYYGMPANAHDAYPVMGDMTVKHGRTPITEDANAHLMMGGPSDRCANAMECQRYTLVEAHLITGRSHQIRAHLAALGYPIVGDVKYGQPRDPLAARFGLRGQLLHAWRMEWEDGKRLEAPLPKQFQNILRQLKILEAGGKQIPTES